ncbi:MAG: FHA domain-containing protein, partial [Mycobacterium sp.]
MSSPSAPALTVRYNGPPRTFAAGNDVVVGRDLRADIRIAHPLISRAHVVLRFDHGRWTAVDNGSLNGMFVHGRRVPEVDITDGMTVNLGNPDGPPMSFEIGRQQGTVGRPQQTSTMVIPPPPPAWTPQPPTRPAPPPPPSQPMYPPASAPVPAPENAPTQMGPSPVRSGGSGNTSNLATSMLKILRPGASPAADAPPGSLKIGRAGDNDIVIPDILASRHHATLIPTPGGMEIADNRSINGTFVNGNRIDRALLNDGDVVTIGNVALVFTGGALVRRTETAAATGTGGLDVRGLTWTIEGNKTLLENISFTARPGTLTAVIGPSGAGKSTLARQIAGYTHPTSGTVSFEG